MRLVPLTLLAPLLTPLPQPARHARLAAPLLMARGADAAPGLSTDDPRVLSVAVDRVTGIDFGCDLQLRWPYVLALVPDGSAARTGEVLLGDQLVAIAGGSVLGLGIGEVMERLAAVDGKQVELTFFRGARDSLQAIVGAASAGPATSTITIKEAGKADIELVVPYGANLRDELIARKINCYQSVTRWTKCVQRLGSSMRAPCPCPSPSTAHPASCSPPPLFSNLPPSAATASSSAAHALSTSSKVWTSAPGDHSMSRRRCERTRRRTSSPGVPRTRRCTAASPLTPWLSSLLLCALRSITNVYGDITVQLMPKIGAAQWTR